MKTIFTAVVLSAISISPVLAGGGNDQGQNGNGQGQNGGHHAAPGPIAGAGLPFIAVGYGVYWLVKRRRRQTD
jgi:hypothetical protein